MKDFLMVAGLIAILLVFIVGIYPNIGRTFGLYPRIVGAVLCLGALICYLWFMTFAIESSLIQ